MLQNFILSRIGKLDLRESVFSENVFFSLQHLLNKGFWSIFSLGEAWSFLHLNWSQHSAVLLSSFRGEGREKKDLLPAASKGKHEGLFPKQSPSNWKFREA